MVCGGESKTIYNYKGMIIWLADKKEVHRVNSFIYETDSIK